MWTAQHRVRRFMGSIAIVTFLVSLTSLTGVPRKDDVQRRLRSLNAVYVEGPGRAADYASRHLMQETCLKRALSADEADAILEIWQRPAPCRSSLSRICLEVSMRLVDQETKKVLYYRTDSAFGGALSLNVDEAAGKWVLWNLNGACCKGR